MLYLAATPIGNLKDLTFHALEVLRCCDLVLCEDTRRSRILLDHYQIDKPTRSWHRFNAQKRSAEICQRLQQGQTVVLLCDAGMPGFSDPGQELLAACQQQGLPYQVLAGSSAILQALLQAGFPFDRFQWLGFLPRKTAAKQRVLIGTQCYPGVSVAFESCHRLLATLQLLAAVAAHSTVCVCRELTKVFEETRRARPALLVDHFQAHPPKGECTLVIPGQAAAADAQLQRCQQQFQLSRRAASQLLGQLYGTRKLLPRRGAEQKRALDN